MSLWVYPGSFDPPTLGHLDIISRASSLCDRLIVAVMVNPDKKCAFSLEERMDMLREITEHLSGVSVDAFQGLQVDFLKEKGAKTAVRGVRNILDFAMEAELFGCNRLIWPDMETVLLLAKPEHSAISSTSAKIIASHGGDIRGLVPACLAERITARCRIV